MSQPSSDPQVLFDSGEVDSALPMASGYEQSPAQTSDARRPLPVMKQPFSIYTVLLILAFVLFTAAAIMFFIDAGKYQ